MSSWREQLAFAPLETAERGEEIGRRIRQAIELGVLEDETQLPSENDLAAMMGVSTQTLRSALAELRHLGLVETRRGRGGGSFVKANTGQLARARRDALGAYSLDALRDIREYRAVLAGSAAAAAAARPQQISVARLASLGAMVGTAHEPADMARADSKFHLELAAASRSVRLTRQEMALQAEVGPLIWTSTAGEGLTAAREHAEIVGAIGSGDTLLARTRAEGHVRREMNALIDLRMSMDTAPQDAALRGGLGEEGAITSIGALAAEIEKTAVASIHVVEEAVHAALDAAPGGGLDELEGVYQIAHDTLVETHPILYGTGFLADSRFFGESGFVWAYVPPGRSTPQRLEMDLEYYDYATAPWWPREGATEPVQASYAYVDANGSNAYIVTFSKCVMREGRMIGAAVADVLVSQLQAGFAPFLESLPWGSCIVDQMDVVIAANSGSLVGDIFSSTAEVARTIALPPVPWRLHLAQAPRPTATPSRSPQAMQTSEGSARGRAD
ncbi:GntR family transcriptional regulator [Sinomonas sp. P10A9]|uniref:GntR family transcriptional regulator n=1 Tax=Sinomonas puerhi TaxID=3238584 RepID=A0AB39L616_9MICC